MAHHKSAIKRLRQAKRRNMRNRHYRTMLRSGIKSLLAEEDQATSAALLKIVTALLDKMAKKGIIHDNKAANQKSRLAKFHNKLVANA